MKRKTLHFFRYILLLNLFIIISCKDKEYNKNVETLKSIVNSNLGKTIIIPDSLQLYKPFSQYIADSSEIKNAKIKIYSQINASCGTCIGYITKWESLSLELKKYNIPVILICQSDDDFELLRFFCESKKIMTFSYPFFIDIESEFLNSNPFMKKSDNFKTVLTDENNTILLMGDPILSAEMKNLYLKEIKKRKNIKPLPNNVYKK
jgi:hypothetical protein